MKQVELTFGSRQFGKLTRPTGPMAYACYALRMVLDTKTGVQGEIDIIEGINDQGPNQLTLHTSPGQ